MFREGELIVRLAIQANRIRAVEIVSTRAPLPARLTHGRQVEEVERTIPLLFSVCARAQGAAASGALAAARGLSADAERVVQRSVDVRREAIVELLTRLLIDWPKALGSAPDVTAAARVRQSPPAQQLEICRDIARERVFGMDTARWPGEMTTDALERWIADGTTLPARLLQQIQLDVPDLGRSDIDTMPGANIEDLSGILPPLGEDTAFSQAPHWLGKPVEAGPLARQVHHPLLAVFVERFGNSVGARFLAHLVELATWLSPENSAGPAVRQHAVAPGIGLGLAQTARGLLLHQAQVSDGRVQHYRIVAPTEWNFHPGGALARGLIDRRVQDGASARRDAALLVQALDPCVACSIEVADA
jgi:hypothetical protein